MMNRISRIDEILSQFKKPCLKKIEDIYVSETDVLITCAGFEERAVEAMHHLIPVKDKSFLVIICDYLPYVSENRLDEMIAICANKKMKYKKMIYDRENPAGIAEDIQYELRHREGRIYIDISGMSRLLIVQLLVSLLKSKNVSIIYSEAREYPPSRDEYKKSTTESTEDLNKTLMFISSGVFEVAVVPELASVSMQGQPVRLIMFPSFNIQQLVALRSEIQPHCYSFIHGVPYLEENRWRLEAIRQLNDIEKIPCKEEFMTSTLIYEETFNAINQIYSKYNEKEKIVISPTGSKMQTVAIGIFRAFMEDVQIIYPTPISFIRPERYTLGVRQMYKLDLDNFNSLLSNS